MTDEITTCDICGTYKGTSQQMGTHKYHCRKKHSSTGEAKVESVPKEMPIDPRATGDEKEKKPLPTIGPFNNYGKMAKDLHRWGKEDRAKKKELKASKRQEKRDAREERKKEKDAVKFAKKRDKHQPKDKFWSEVHPEGYASARKILPRLHMYIFGVVLALLMLQEILKKNYDFLIDWYNATWILPQMNAVITGDFNAWWQQYGVQTMIVIWFLVLVYITFYLFVWRAFFKTYIKFSQGSERPEGRVYWRTNNMWTRKFDKWYGSPPRKMNTYYIKQGFWPLFNIVNPTSSLARLDTTLGESCEELGIWKIKVSERRHRIKVGNDQKHLITSDVAFPNGYIPTPYAQDLFADMAKKCVDDTTDLSFANATTRNTVMTSGLRLASKKTRKNIIDSRQQKQQQPDNNKSD